MHREKGFLCFVQFKFWEACEEVWFGPRNDVSLGNQSFENTTTNGTKLFPTQEEAEASLEEIKQNREVSENGIGYMEIDIAETEVDREVLRGGERIIILHITDMGTELLGPNLSENDKSTIYPLEAERFTVNGAIPFAKYPNWIYREISRQGGKVNLARLVAFRKVYTSKIK